jgi:hypothetical protein
LFPNLLTKLLDCSVSFDPVGIMKAGGSSFDKICVIAVYLSLTLVKWYKHTPIAGLEQSNIADRVWRRRSQGNRFGMILTQFLRDEVAVFSVITGEL